MKTNTVAINPIMAALLRFTCVGEVNKNEGLQSFDGIFDNFGNFAFILSFYSTQ